MENRALTKSSWPTILSEMFRLECLHRTWDRGRKLAHRFKTVQWELEGVRRGRRAEYGKAHYRHV